MTPLQQSSTDLADFVLDHIERLPEDIRTQAAIVCADFYTAMACQHISELKRLIDRPWSNVVQFPIIHRPIPKVQP